MGSSPGCRGKWNFPSLASMEFPAKSWNQDFSRCYLDLSCVFIDKCLHFMAILSQFACRVCSGSGCASHQDPCSDQSLGNKLCLPNVLERSGLGEQGKKQTNHSSQRPNCSISELTYTSFWWLSSSVRKQHFLQKCCLKLEFPLEIWLWWKNLWWICACSFSVFLEQELEFLPVSDHRALLAGSVYKYK